MLVTRRSVDSISGNAAATSTPGAPRNLRISIPKWCGRWAVGVDEFKEGVVGAKSRNLANLRGKLPDWVKVPPAVTVPFGSFEKVRLCRGLSRPACGCTNMTASNSISAVLHGPSE